MEDIREFYRNKISELEEELYILKYTATYGSCKSIEESINEEIKGLNRMITLYELNINL
jgi:hypothetical protein